MPVFIRFLASLLLAQASIVHVGSRPDIVIIMSDDMGYSDRGWMATTPTVLRPSRDYQAASNSQGSLRSATATLGLIPHPLWG